MTFMQRGEEREHAPARRGRVVLLNGVRARAAGLSRWLAVFGLLVAMAAVLLRPALWERSTLPGGFGMSDLVISHWPNALLIKATVARDHRLPLWNPTYGGGRPAAADPLAALWYPPTHIVHQLDIRDSLLALQVGHLLLAGLGVVVLARAAFKLSFAAALTAGLAFMATPRLIGHLGAGHLTMVQTVAWLPWVALTCRATVRDPARWCVPFGACLALMALAGHPQVAYYGGLMAFAVALWLVVGQGRRAGYRSVLAPLAGLGLAGLLAGLLAAAHLLPLAEFTAHSTRQRSVRSTDALALFSLLQALVGIRQSSPVPHEALFEPGLGILGLAVLGVATRPRSGLPVALGVLLAAGLALGVSSPLYRAAAFVLPSFDMFRGLARIWFLGLLGIAVLAGLGAETVATWIRGAGRRGAPAAGICALFLLALSLVQADSGLARVEAVRQHIKPSELDRAAASLAGAGRIYGVQRNMRQAAAATLGARLADGWDPLLIEPYVTFMQRAGGYSFRGYQLSVPPFEVYDPGYATSREAQPDPALLGLVNVSIVLSRTPLTDPDLRRVQRVDNTLIYRNTANAGAAYLVAADAQGLPPTIDGIQRIRGKVVIHEQRPERLGVGVTAPAGSWLVIGSPAFPGWVAVLDGRPARVVAIDGVLPAVYVGPGQHEITYMYRPASVYRGVALSLGGLLIGLGWLAGYFIVTTRRRIHTK